MVWNGGGGLPASRGKERIHMSTGRRLTTLSIGFSAFTLLLLLGGSAAGASPMTLSHVGVHRGTNVNSGTTTLRYCGEGTKWIATGYFCQRASAVGPSSTIWSYTDLLAQVSVSNLSGSHSFYESGRLNLPADYARYSATCFGENASASAYAYIFWHVWVFDRTTGVYVTQSNSGYLWEPTVAASCGGVGNSSGGSPALSGNYNSSAYASTGSTSYDFSSSQHYVFMLFVGCSAIAETGLGAGSHASANCNFASNPQRNTVSITGLDIV
jgi:hypothetical protein